MDFYQNILLAIDFSEDGHYVAQRARQLADKFNARLHLVHVLDNIPMPDIPYGMIIPLDEDSSYSLLEEEKDRLKKISKSLRIELAHQWMIWGEPQQEITKLATQKKIDLIVVGSHGRHGFSALMSSTAKGILYHAGCDVLAIHLN